MGSFWKKAWQGSGSGEFLFFVFAERSLRRSLLNGGLEDIEKQTRVENEGEEKESFWRSTCVLLGASGMGTFIKIQKRNWVEA